MKIKLIILLIIAFSTVSFTPYKQSPTPTAAQLRANYAAALINYKGAAYGTGEDGWGISCSTLVQQALIDSIGYDKAARSGIESHRCLTEQLGQGCDGQLSLVLRAANLQKIDYDKIQPGDIAVVGNRVGIHTLAYIGNQTWIHADPFTEKVIESEVGNDNSYWFTLQVSVMRWNALNEF